MPEVITDNLDLWSSALLTKSTAGRGSNGKLEAYGIKKLRELILELAVRGKLVPQDPGEEPASVLLEQIAKEKARFIGEGRLGRSQSLPAISSDEIPFEIPEKWEWIRLGDLGLIFNGNSISEREKETKYTNIKGGLPFIATKDVGYGWQELDYENGVSIPENEPNFKVARKGAVLICSEGGSAGKKCGIAAKDICFGNKLYALVPFAEANPDFLLANYLTPTFFAQFAERMTGIIGGISLANFGQLVVPLPSINEQHRIVAKVDELMALCDQLEQQQTHSIEAHHTLVETLLGTLTRVASQQELTARDGEYAENAGAIFDNEAWTRIANHFDTLFTTEHSIDQLKQTILQLAVMGKLVPQDPNDEPASEFLKKVANEKARLIKERGIRKQNELPEIKDEEISFNLPAGWVVSRLGIFTSVGTGATPSRDQNAYWSPQEVNWVASGETSNDFIKETSEKISSLAVKETNVTVYPVGTLIVAMYGQGKTRGQVSELMIEAGTNQACAAVVLINKDEAHRKYLKLFFKKAYEEMRSHSAGGAQPNLNVGKISNTVVPIPPLAEQKRIVAKVEELMALCDALKARLAEAQTTQIHLADAIVEQAVA